jgi:hypothetical protein
MIASGARENPVRQIAEPFRPVVTLAIVNLLRDRCLGLVFRAGNTVVRAGVAQLVEHLICNQTVGGSSPFASSRVSFSPVIPPQSFHTDGKFPLSWLRGKASAEWGRVDDLRLRGDVFGQIGSLFVSVCDCAQVAERLMAADCKSAAPWSYGGSNPPLCTMGWNAGVENWTKPDQCTWKPGRDRRGVSGSRWGCW